tara:strand:+ start:232 stop:855 length:624 start_codon:yes stop_codon:yes gene_type:complete
MKYIFVAGAPGSKWSSVCKNIYFGKSIDTSDYSPDRLYWHDASGEKELMHLGAYFDPGMEFGGFFDELPNYSKEVCEAEFDSPFAGGEGVRIIKSHVFAHHIDFLKENWPDCPIVLVHRDDDACLGWWVKCGHFDITYPLYHKYYKNLKEMSKIITHQNTDILDAWEKYDGITPRSNIELAVALDIKKPDEAYQQDYASKDIRVKVI